MNRTSSACSSTGSGVNGLPGVALKHVQEVAGEAQALGRRDDRLALSSTCRIRGERRRLRDDAGIWRARTVVSCDVLALRDRTSPARRS